MNSIQLDTALKHWNYLYCGMWSFPLLTMCSLWKCTKSQYLLDHHISKLLHELYSLPSSCEAANWSIFLTQAAGNCQQVTALVFGPSRRSDLTALQMAQMSNWHHWRCSFWVWKETDLPLQYRETILPTSSPLSAQGGQYLSHLVAWTKVL